MLENAGSMANTFRQYIQDTSGVPESCIHRINTSSWSAVSRNRYFFVSNNSFILPSKQADPWDHGWMLPKPKHKANTPPMPPWLRTRGLTSRGNIRFTTSAYHPRHFLYHTAYFGSIEAFRSQCGLQGWPDLPWTDFLPLAAARALQVIIQWGAPVAQLPNKEQEVAAAVLADFLDHPRFALPFRLPSLAEKVVDAELTSFAEDSMHDVTIPDRLMHDLIGNYFKPSAVITALGGKHYLQRLKCGEAEQVWQPCSPNTLLAKYAGIRQQVLGSIDQNLRGYCCDVPFFKGIPICSDEFWHIVRALPPDKPKIVGAAPAPPLLSADIDPALTEPRSILTYLSHEPSMLRVIQRSPYTELCALERSICFRKSDCLVSLIPLAYVTLIPPISQVFAYGCDSGNRLRPLLPRVSSLLVIVATVPPTNWTVLVTFSPGRLLRVYWSHCATLPHGSFLSELQQRRIPVTRRTDMPQEIIQASSQLEQGIILRLLRSEETSAQGPPPPIINGLGYVHNGAITWQLWNTITHYDCLTAIAKVLGIRGPPSSQHKYQPAAFSSHATSATSVLLAPSESRWQPTIWYARAAQPHAPEAHDRTPVVFCRAQERAATALVRNLVRLFKAHLLTNLTKAMRLAWHTMYADQPQSRSFFRVRSLNCFSFLCDLPVDFTIEEFRTAYHDIEPFYFQSELWLRLGVHAVQRRLDVYTQACPSNLHVCTWNVTSLAALPDSHDKLAHIRAGRVKGFTLLQETNWTESQPATLTTAHPHINIAVSNVPAGQTGSGGVCILPPLGWVQLEHTEIIPGYLQDALYEKHGTQLRVINVYVRAPSFSCLVTVRRMHCSWR